MSSPSSLQESSTAFGSRVSTMWGAHRAGVQSLAIFATIVVAASLLSGGTFLQPSNLRNLLLQGAILGVVALGQLLVVITGGIDLSVGATLAFSSVLFVSIQIQGYGLVLAAVVALMGALCIGLVNGALVSYFRLPPFVVTLAVMEIGTSLAQVLTGGAAINTSGDGTPGSVSLTDFGSGELLGFPLTALVWIAVLAAVAMGLRTRNGSFFYPVGGNEQAAKFSAIPVAKIRMLAYVACSLLAGIAGLLFVVRVGGGDPQAGTPYLLDSIAAVVIGGASLFGGRGSAIGTLIGVLTLGVLGNVVNLVGVSPSMQEAVKGIVILLAVILSTIRRR